MEDRGAAQSLIREAEQGRGSSAEELTRAYLDRIALTNARARHPGRPRDQRRRDQGSPQARHRSGGGTAPASPPARTTRAPAASRPLGACRCWSNDTIDAKSLRHGGSIALQGLKPANGSTLVAKAEAAGAIVLGTDNVTEAERRLRDQPAEGYSSLGGQVLLPNDTDKTRAGSSAGAAAALTASVWPRSRSAWRPPSTRRSSSPRPTRPVSGGLKPTVGLVKHDRCAPCGQVSRTPPARSPQASRRRDDPQRDRRPRRAGRTTRRTQGRRPRGQEDRRGVQHERPLPGGDRQAPGLGATVTQVSIAAPAATDSVVATEFKRDLNAYLGAAKPGTTLRSIIDYNDANDRSSA
ncbi:hypothetical protein [Streptosporangium vulgare]|uniref:hypothetical protein n=1 Tax=Streptosporangium vulgare TaxID=46190 RepID=UPI0031D55A9C